MTATLLRPVALLAFVFSSVFAVAENPALPKPTQVEGGYLKVGFEILAGYKFEAPPFDPSAPPTATPATGEEQIPAEIKELSGKAALVTGYMMPVRMENGLVTEFLLVRDPAMCCYGTVPNMNEWIVVKMKNGVRPLMDVPVSFYGKLQVGAMFENGYPTGIYLLEGERMGAVQQG
jgi:hypothetical protein